MRRKKENINIDTITEVTGHAEMRTTRGKAATGKGRDVTRRLSLMIGGGRTHLRPETWRGTIIVAATMTATAKGGGTEIVTRSRVAILVIVKALEIGMIGETAMTWTTMQVDEGVGRTEIGRTIGFASPIGEAEVGPRVHTGTGKLERDGDLVSVE